jgi:hypothetical protein
VPGQSSRSVKRSARSERGRAADLSPLHSPPNGRSRQVDCADARMRLQGVRRRSKRGQKEARRPAARTPSLPIVPESFRRAPLTRRIPKVLGNRTLISHGAPVRQRARVEGLPSPKFGVAVGADAALEAPAPGGRVASYGPTRPSLPGPPG